MLLSLLATTVVAPVYAHALGIFAVICNDPGDDCSGWSPITSAVSEHPETQFYIVINADNYCISTTGTQFNRVRDLCVPGLRPANNSVVLGYVDSDQSSSKVLAAIDTYTKWNDVSRPTGMFFDCMSSTSSITKYQPFIAHTHEKGFDFIALNPEDPPNPDYYPQANIVITYIDSFGSFNATKLKVSSSTPASKQVVVLEHGPTSNYSAKISELASAGIAAAYITDKQYDSELSIHWRQFVSDLAGPEVTQTSASPSSSSTVRSTNTPSPEDDTPPSPPTGAIVGGVFGAVIVVFLIILVFVLGRRRRILARSPDSSVDPFRSIQRQTLETIEKYRISNQQVPSSSSIGRPITKQRIEFLTPSALPVAGGSTGGPPSYSAGSPGNFDRRRI